VTVVSSRSSVSNGGNRRSQRAVAICLVGNTVDRVLGHMTYEAGLGAEGMEAGGVVD
jgi:hypothetical protein